MKVDGCSRVPTSTICMYLVAAAEDIGGHHELLLSI
jgi:hypothetical protein